MLLYIFYIIISPVLYLLLNIFRLFSYKINEHWINEKKLLIHVEEKITAAKNKKIILLHAASAGEFEQIKPILKKINKNKFFIVQSFTSPTIYKKEKNNPLFDISCYHSYDFLWSSYLFFKTIKPYKYIITRHDVWPTHMLICKLLNIESYYINANIHKNSIWSYRFLQSFSRKIFSQFKIIFVPSNQINNLFINILGGGSSIIIAGDSRFDQILDRKKDNNYNLLPMKYKEMNNIIFGSYDAFDEDLIFNSLIKVFYNGDKDLKKRKAGIILVPHEVKIQTINSLIKKLKNKMITAIKLSDNSHDNANVIIVDRVGILADLYKYARLAYVGSGFTTGVHSVIEPAVYGCTVGHGPNIGILDEAKDMFNNNMSHLLKSQNDLTEFIDLIDKPKKLFNEDIVKKYISNSSGATLRIIKEIGL